MNKSSSRLGRLSWYLLALLLAASTSFAADPAKTLISDTLYRADGTAAAGTLLISWPAFVTADAKPVAAGTLKVTIGAGGAINLPLVPTQGAIPAGSYYKVVLKLDDGATSTEFWSVPTLSPTTIAAIRSSVVPASVALQVVSREYVDSADALSLHKTGDETLAGVKTFSSSPLVPEPTTGPQAASKLYVDAAISAAGGSGNADTVDGKHATDLQSRVALVTVDYGGGDIGTRINAALADFGMAPACGELIIPQGTHTMNTTVSLNDRKGCNIHGVGMGLEGSGGTVLKWTGEAGGTMFRIAGNVRGGRFHDFQLDGNGLASFCFDMAGAAGQSTSSNDLHNIFIWNCTGTNAIGFRFGDSSGGNPDLSSNSIRNLVVSYNSGTMKDEFQQNGTQTVGNHIADSVFAYTGTATAPTSYMRLNAGDASVDNVQTVGGIPAGAGNGVIVVEPAMNWARFTNLYHEVGGGTLVAPVYNFPAGSRLWPTYLKGVRIKWEASDPANKIIDYEQRGGTLSIEDGSINSDADGNPGHGTVTVNAGVGAGYPTNLIWRNNPIYPNNRQMYLDIGSKVYVASDWTSLWNTKNDETVYSDVSGYAGHLVWGSGATYTLRDSTAAANAGTWQWITGPSSLTLRALDDTRTAASNAISISRSPSYINVWGLTLGAATTAPNFLSNVAIGTQPYATTSTTLNTNLNADMLDDKHAGDILTQLADPGADHKWIKYVDAAGTQQRAQPSSADLGDAATLNADTVDSKHAAEFAAISQVPAAGSCTNQVVTALNNGAAPSCGNVTNAMLAPASYRVFLGGHCTGVAGNGQVISVVGLGATAVSCNQSSAPAVSGAMMSSAATIKNLYINEGSGQKNGTSMAWTVYKNNVATALTCTVPNGQTTCNDAVHSLTVAAGDIITLKSGNTAPSNESLANVSVAMELWN